MLRHPTTLPSPQIGVCCDLKDAGAIKAAGFDYLEGNVSSLLVPSKSEAEFAKSLEQIKKSALPVRACAGFLPSSLKVVGPEANHDAAAKYAETALQRAGVANVRIIVFGSGGARKIPEGFDPAKAREQFIAFAKRIAPAAEKADVMLVLEPLNRKETNFINTITEGAAIVSAVAHPAFMLHADLYHMMQENESPDVLVKEGTRIFHVHAAQRDRSAPLPGGTDLKPFFKALKSIGYHRRISLECKWGKATRDFADANGYIQRQWAEA